MLKPEKRAARRRPLLRKEITIIRVTFLLVAAFAAVTLATGLLSHSVWRAIAIGAAVGGLGYMATCTWYQLRQIVGVSPPATRDG
jgi:uncharacterized membrane protein (DUF485 family)